MCKNRFIIHQNGASKEVQEDARDGGVRGELKQLHLIYNYSEKIKYQNAWTCKYLFLESY